MYVINTFLRLVRFVANSFVGLFVGFLLGYFVSSSGFSPILEFLK